MSFFMNDINYITLVVGVVEGPSNIYIYDLSLYTRCLLCMQFCCTYPGYDV